MARNRRLQSCFPETWGWPRNRDGAWVEAAWGVLSSESDSGWRVGVVLGQARTLPISTFSSGSKTGATVSVVRATTAVAYPPAPGSR